MNSLSYFTIYTIIVLMKMILLIYFSMEGHEIFGGGNDSNYYDAYAQGHYDVAVNIWPVILRNLNEVGLYSRFSVTIFLMFIGVGVLPFLIANISVDKEAPLPSRIYWFAVVVISVYPTLFYYTLDIYRDVFMLLVYVIGLVVVKRYVQVRFGAEKILLLSSILVIAFFLYLLRPYIGFAFMSALLFYRLYSFKRFPLLLSVICYLLALNALSMIGVFDNILQYRSYFISEVSGGSNLNISFDSPMMFIPSLVTSFTFQMLGVFFVNVSAMLVFFVESVPFIIAFYYLIKNRKFSNEFVDYLVVFFVVYSTIWLLGNDNLGTAVRLRMFSYLSIFIACMIVYQNKLIFLNKIKQA